jgi:hypothetical protein
VEHMMIQLPLVNKPMPLGSPSPHIPENAQESPALPPALYLQQLVRARKIHTSGTGQAHPTPRPCGRPAAKLPTRPHAADGLPSSEWRSS